MSSWFGRAAKTAKTEKHHLDRYINLPKMFEGTIERRAATKESYKQLHKIYNEFKKIKKLSPGQIEADDSIKEKMKNTVNKFLEILETKEFKDFFVTNGGTRTTENTILACGQIQRKVAKSESSMIIFVNLYMKEFIETNDLFKDFFSIHYDTDEKLSLSIKVKNLEKFIKRIKDLSDGMDDHCAKNYFKQADLNKLVKESLENNDIEESYANTVRKIQSTIMSVKTKTLVAPVQMNIKDKLTERFYVYKQYCENNENLCENLGEAELNKIKEKLVDSPKISYSDFSKYMESEILSKSTKASLITPNKILDDYFDKIKQDKPTIYYYLSNFLTKPLTAPVTSDLYNDLISDVSELIEKYIEKNHKKPNDENIEEMIKSTISEYMDPEKFINKITKEEIDDIYEELTKNDEHIGKEAKDIFDDSKVITDKASLKTDITEKAIEYIKIYKSKLIKTPEITGYMIRELKKELDNKKKAYRLAQPSLPPTPQSPPPTPPTPTPPTPPTPQPPTAQSKAKPSLMSLFKRGGGRRTIKKGRKTIKKGRKGSKKTRRH